MNGLRLKNKVLISWILPIFLITGAVMPPFLVKEVKAAEIGMVGALPGDVTLWEIYQTIFAAAGIIIANEEVQNSALSNFGSSSYTLEEMQSMGFIPIGTDGSNALDWDWSGLENELQNSNSEDAKIIRGVFSQNGGQGSGGNNEDPDNDPWYKKAVNWAKSVVKNGKVYLHDNLEGVSGTAGLALSSIGQMFSDYASSVVEMGEPITNVSRVSAHITDLYCYESYYYQGYRESYYNISTDGEIRVFYTKKWSNNDTKLSATIVFALRGASSNATINFKHILGSNENNTTYTINNNNIYRIPDFSQSISNNVVPNISFKNGVECPNNDAVNKARNWASYGTGGDVIPNKSPDLITPTGNAIVPNGSPSWVPTPYIDGNEHLEIIPQPDIEEFTQYITVDNPEMAPAGEAWIDTVSPYIGNNPTPAPTTRPKPTTKPNISPIPEGEPGGEDNPINVTEPDPMPDIEDGYGTTYELMDYFPFCIPADFVRAYKIFEVSDDYRHAPYIDWNLKIERFGIDEHIVLDFSIFDSAAAVFRILVFISFCISLLLITKTLIWS